MWVCRLMYRVKPFEECPLPSEGPALIVCDHTSLGDAMVLLATAGRPVRFLRRKRFILNAISGGHFGRFAVFRLNEANGIFVRFVQCWMAWPRRRSSGCFPKADWIDIVWMRASRYWLFGDQVRRAGHSSIHCLGRSAFSDVNGQNLICSK